MTATNTFIRVRTQFEGFHFYPGASEIDSRISFLEHPHRHIFKVEVKISVGHLDRELEFFLVKWALEAFIKSGDQNHKSCEMIATDILEQHLIPAHGANRYYEVTVSEDGESDGIVEHQPATKGTFEYEVENLGTVSESDTLVVRVPATFNSKESERLQHQMLAQYPKNKFIIVPNSLSITKESNQNG